MYLDLGQTVLMLCRWIHCLRLKQCLSSYYVCLFLLVHQPPISSSFNLLAFYPSHPHLYFHFYTHTHMQTLLFQTFISISPFIFPHRHPMSKTTLFLTVFQFTPLTNRTLNGPILFLCTLTCPTHPPPHPTTSCWLSMNSALVHPVPISTSAYSYSMMEAAGSFGMSINIYRQHSSRSQKMTILMYIKYLTLQTYYRINY